MCHAWAHPTLICSNSYRLVCLLSLRPETLQRHADRFNSRRLAVDVARTLTGITLGNSGKPFPTQKNGPVVICSTEIGRGATDSPGDIRANFAPLLKSLEFFTIYCNQFEQRLGMPTVNTTTLEP